MTFFHKRAQLGESPGEVFYCVLRSLRADSTGHSSKRNKLDIALDIMNSLRERIRRMPDHKDRKKRK